MAMILRQSLLVFLSTAVSVVEPASCSFIRHYTATTSNKVLSSRTTSSFRRSITHISRTAKPPDFSVIEEDDNDLQNDFKLKKKSPPDFSFDGKSYNTMIDDDGSSKPSSFTRKTKEVGVRNKSVGLGREKPLTRRDAPGLAQGSSWMARNAAFLQDDADDEDNDDRMASYKSSNQGGDGSKRSTTSRTFRQDFRGTRVFVQNLPPDVTWQDLKDHFRTAGVVVFASVSADPVTGQSKGSGIVQFETTEMALTAIAIMRNYPLKGQQLFVREDVQTKEGAELGSRSSKDKKKGPTPPSKWKCANEENAAVLSEDERKAVLSLIRARDDARRRKQYDVSDKIREELKANYNVHIDDRLYMWWTVLDGNQVPQTIHDIKGKGRWGDLKPWRQIPTTPENDACVNPDLVNALLTQRDLARKEKDFSTADALLEKARTSPDGDLYLRIHDESRTWRIWTNEPPPRPVTHAKSPAEQCIEIVTEHAPEKVDEVKKLLESFPGREYSILRKLKQRYTE